MDIVMNVDRNIAGVGLKRAGDVWTPRIELARQLIAQKFARRYQGKKVKPKKFVSSKGPPLDDAKSEDSGSKED